jgi:hypothetical protein
MLNDLIAYDTYVEHMDQTWDLNEFVSIRLSSNWVAFKQSNLS